MAELADATSALLAQVMRLIKNLSDEDMKRIAAGETKLVLQRPGQRVMDTTPAVDKTLKVVQQLTADDLRRLEGGGAKLKLVRTGGRIVYPLDPAEVAAEVTKQTSEEAIVRLLDADTRLTQANLKKVAAELNINFPSTIKSKPAMQLHIAQRVASDRGRWSWR